MARRSLIGVRYSAAAAKEYRAQLKHYAESAPGLEIDFASAIDRAASLARWNPEGFPCIDPQNGTRAVIVRRFPFRLLYILRGDFVVVTAVMHTSRSPDALLRRR